ncbi:MFS transporter [Rhodococcus sp. NPDC127530]|uniref:MFS transporter n=1 Tax=unclassified Rhodococcus (in: high G+C Gram-positive bacteria) TaxID=192944 RepID=UPI0036260D31
MTTSQIEGHTGHNNPDVRSAVRKFFARFIPLIMIMVVLNQIDRTNVGYIKEHLESDLGIGPAAYGLGAGLFFVAYAIFEVPSNMIMQRVGARVWLTRIMVTWGLVVIGTGFVQTETQFYTARFLLGVAEAGFVPGVLYYFGYWLPQKYRGRATALLLSGSALAYVVSGPLSGALLELDGVLGISGWKWMLWIEGTMTVAVGIVAFFFLVSKIADAKWLTAAEKAALTAAIEEEDDARDRAQGVGVSKWKLLLNGQVLLMCLVFFFIQLVGYTMTFWLPTQVKALGDLSSFEIGLITSIPWILSIVAMNFAGRTRDKFPTRTRLIVTAALVLAAVGTFVATAGNPLLGLFGMCLAAMGFKSASPVFLTIPQALLSAKIYAPGIALVTALGNLGGFVAPTVLGALEEATGSITIGLYGLTTMALLAIVVLYLIKRNDEAETGAASARLDTEEAVAAAGSQDSLR